MRGEVGVRRRIALTPLSEPRTKKMLPKPLLAASLEPLVLALLAKGETYGYEIIQKIQDMSDGRIMYKANRLYPLLHDLENKGMVSVRWHHDGAGPGRKYYKLTPKGEDAMAKARQAWLDVNALLAQLWGAPPAFNI